ncbi:hypothetical protein GCM10020358_20880 [Amorphoplanes nipponensis]|uniref:Uncharacterized protein n=1 Tax=Actinoplanes nipponensis TaxID=135950 RepID=A0A919MH64_9ACTN|nr:hypothetical protein [Actinoplanes nipponensis]GIE49339.1 hypothetical protein Ani05nite_28730 [Actinoplanes nipponensis]
MTLPRTSRRRPRTIDHPVAVVPRARPAENSGPERETAGGVEFRDVVAAGSALLLLLFIIKSYGVARYSLTTTTALLVATPSQVALGTVTIYAYYVLPAVAIGTVWFAVLLRDRVRPSWWPLIGIVAGVAALASPLTYLIRGLAVLVVALWAEMVMRRYRRAWAARSGERYQRRRRILASLRGQSIVYLGAGALAGLFLFSLDVPWVSAQTFQVTDPTVVSTQNKKERDNEISIETANRFVGYPIAENEEWVTVLHADTRYIMRIPQKQIQFRLTCHNEQDQLHGDRPLFEALRGHPYDSHNIDCRKVLDELAKRPLGQPFPVQ